MTDPMIWGQKRFPNRYAPFATPLDIPSSGVFDSPNVCLTINKEWASIVMGALRAAAYAEYNGTEQEQEDAQQQIEQLVLAIAVQQAICEAGEGGMIRVNPEDSCQIQQSLDGGESWQNIFRLDECFVIPTVTTQDIGTGYTVEFDMDSDGNPESQITLLHGVNGTNGADGADGANGTEIFSEDVVVEPADRTLDHIFNTCMELVQWCYEATYDSIVSVELSVDATKALTDLLSSVPVWGEIIDVIGVQDMVSFVSGVAEVSSAIMLAGYDVNVQRDLACALFCEIRTNENKFDVGVWQNAIAEWEILAFSEPAIGAMAVFGNIVGLMFTRVTRQYTLGLNDSDSDWNLLCLSCNGSADPCRVYVSSSLEAWEAWQGYPGTLATWDAGNVAWVTGVQTGNNDTHLWIALPTESPVGTYRVTFNGSFNPAFGNPQPGIVAIDSSNDIQEQSVDEVFTPVGGNYSATGTISITQSGLRLAVILQGEPGHTTTTLDYVNIECL